MRGTRTMNWREKKQGAVTYSTKGDNDLIK